MEVSRKIFLFRLIAPKMPLIRKKYRLSLRGLVVVYSRIGVSFTID